jgi:hypothetical protein
MTMLIIDLTPYPESELSYRVQISQVDEHGVLRWHNTNIQTLTFDAIVNDMKLMKILNSLHKGHWRVIRLSMEDVVHIDNERN